MDWAVFQIPGVEQVCERAAAAVCRLDAYAAHVEYDDMKQEAMLAAASMPDRVRECAEFDGFGGPHLGTLKNELERDLLHIAATLRRRGEKSTSYEDRYDETRENGDLKVTITQSPSETQAGAYDRELVELLLPAVWDPAYCYGMQAENAPDGDMPRGSSNKATGNTLAAHLVDIKVGWKKAPLTIKERRALLLAYGLDWAQRDIAYNQECSQQMVSRRVENGVGKIVAELNGGDMSVFLEGQV